MTPEICVALAKALRRALAESDDVPAGMDPHGKGWWSEAYNALKRFDDLPKNMAGEYRVFWEIDALDAETPREAAQEAWRAMRRVDSQANVFTVMPPDGMLHTIDLGEDPP